MKLWLIIYAGSKIGGVVGPLPYDMHECEKYRDDLRAAQFETISSRFSKTQNRSLDDADVERVKALRFECEMHDARPAMTASP